MVRRPAVQEAQVNVRARGLRETAKEILEQFRLQAADVLRRKFPFADQVRTSAEIDGRRRERFVHGHQKISGAQNAALRAERLAHRLAENDAGVLDGVVLIDFEIASAQ
jgi:hypothetical protein